MSGYTVKELKKIIMIYKKSNCPAVSRARRDELLTMIKDLNINVDEREPLERKKREPKKERAKMRLPKADKIDLSQFENMVEFPKNKKIEKTKDKTTKDNLIGGDDILRLVNDPKEFLENIKSMYPLGYDNLKNGLEKIVKKKLDEDKLLIMSKFFKKELKKPKFFNKTFLIDMLKSKSQEQVQDIIASVFRLINKKLLKKNIIISDYNFIDEKYTPNRRR
jgi:hypothetical protein